MQSIYQTWRFPHFFKKSIIYFCYSVGSIIINCSVCFDKPVPDDFKPSTIYEALDNNLAGSEITVMEFMRTKGRPISLQSTIQVTKKALLMTEIRDTLQQSYFT